ncbi:hypothetical protein Nepgr_009058 [Nepenthes gracilis]|uniref:Pentatricopeptide repeat-containing protein n=1 Tax=Nepenthes gracilis TaxID=150966 RepID=A0AAD3S9N9_NEPGR|nr:hypothetical protein Nepgr_009058 [Nepenthes gracilis]
MFMKQISKLHYSSFVFQSPEESQILSLCKLGSLSEALRLLNSTDREKISAKTLLYASLLQTSTKTQSFLHGLQIHAHIIKSGLQNDRFVGNSLLSLYFKLAPNFGEARKVFDGLFVKDVVSWTSVISGYVRVGKPVESLELFWDMLDFGVEANAFTLSAAVKACSVLRDLKLGRCFHGIVLRQRFDSNLVIASALIDMYGRSDEMDDARQVFDELPEPDAVCWTSIISALTRTDRFEEAFGLFYAMQRKYRLIPDDFTYGSLLTACGNLGQLQQGKQLHAKVITEGFCGNVEVESSLVDMYGKCRKIEESRRVFDRMHNKNSVSCCALLGGYCHNGDFKSVIELFRIMEVYDLYSFGTVLRACAGLAAVRQGKEVHGQYLRKGGWRHVIVESALVDLYAKSGRIDYAQRVFVHMSVKNLITWNSMICGFAQNGRGDEAVDVFNRMVEEGVKPDYISFVGVLFACSHAGLVDQGRQYFTSMSLRYGIRPGVEHFNCMVDLLGRAGLIEEAENVIDQANGKDISSLWPAILGACTTCRNLTAAERVAMKMMEREPNNHLSYIHLANVYKGAGRWSDALKIRKLMKDRGVEKMPGRSSVDSQNSLGNFALSFMNRKKQLGICDFVID